MGDPCDVGEHENNNGSYRQHPTDCSKYLQCLHGSYGERSCSNGTHWNATVGACDWPEKAGCVTFDFEQKNVVGGQCRVGDHGNNSGLYVEHPDDCDKFLVCLNGAFGQMSCPSGLHWNSEASACDWPEKAKCQRNAYKQPPYPVPPTQYIN